MSYDFTFDLSRLSQPLFKEIAEFSEKERVHEKIGDMARNIVQKFHVDKITGLPICDSITVIEDLINIQRTNISQMCFNNIAIEYFSYTFWSSS